MVLDSNLVKVRVTLHQRTKATNTVGRTISRTRGEGGRSVVYVEENAYLCQDNQVEAIANCSRSIRGGPIWPCVPFQAFFTQHAATCQQLQLWFEGMGWNSTCLVGPPHCGPHRTVCEKRNTHAALAWGKLFW